MASFWWLFTILLALLASFFQRHLFSIGPSSYPNPPLTRVRSRLLDRAIEQCQRLERSDVDTPVSHIRDVNPRWSASTNNKRSTLLRNAKLFDGETFLDFNVDILIKQGLIAKVVRHEPQSSDLDLDDSNVDIVDLDGRYVTPGLVDMHSHHLIWTWPSFSSLADVNEMSLPSGPLTPFLRVQDSAKTDDLSISIIASGGVTSSLILPGSTNLMSGEAFLVKNFLSESLSDEGPVESMMLQKGVPGHERQRYMKIGYGQGTRDAYKRSRMGSAWLLRDHLSKAKNLQTKQDEFCEIALTALKVGNNATLHRLATHAAVFDLDEPGNRAMESTIAMLRGKVDAHIHVFTTEDMKQLMDMSTEFGFRIGGFHHANEAWRVGDMIKKHSQEQKSNITAVLFASFGHHNEEGRHTNLWAGKILTDGGVPVAYHSDHAFDELNAKYLIYQAATAHSFQVPEDLSLQSVTSVPAKAIKMDHRIGYVRPGFDADVVVWDRHPLSLAATPLQVYIDGDATLDMKQSAALLPDAKSSRPSGQTQMRKHIHSNTKTRLCSKPRKKSSFTITGIKRNFLEPSKTQNGPDYEMVITDGKITCYGASSACASKKSEDNHHIDLAGGYILPGLTAFSNHFGLAEWRLESSTSDGEVAAMSLMMEETVVYAKNGINLEGQLFKRAQLGGVTRAVVPPLQQFRMEGSWGGVSVGIKTGEKHTIVNGGIFKDDIALHIMLGQSCKSTDSTVSARLAQLKTMLSVNRGQNSTFGAAADGKLPVLIHTHSKAAMLQLVRLKKELDLKPHIVIFGGTGAPAIATQLAEAEIPVILAGPRNGPESWEKKDALVGPPLTVSPLDVLFKAGVRVAIAQQGVVDSHIHSLLLDASWAAKLAGLDEETALGLVSWNIEKILGLEVDENRRDFVIYDSNPFEFGANVVMSFDGGDGTLLTCYPDQNDGHY